MELTSYPLLMARYLATICTFQTVLIMLYEGKSFKNHEEEVKLPAHRAGLPGKVISYHIVPFLPAGRQGPPPIPLWRDGARSGQH